MQYKMKAGSWAFFLHRLTGVMLIGYLLIHIFVLTSLFDPAAFAVEMEMLSSPVFQAFEFLLFLPILFHSFNGLRLVIVEWTDKGSKNHKTMVIAVYVVSVILATAMLIIFLGHEPLEKSKQQVNEYTKRAVEQVKR